MDQHLEARVRLLEDKEALRDLMNDYQRLGDEKRYRDWSECWTDDATFETSFGSLQGKQQIFEVCDEQMKVFARQEHVIGNMRFQVAGDEATGTGILVFIGVYDESNPAESVKTGGHYDWQFRRTEAGWKLHRSRLTFIWSEGDRTGMFTAPT